MMETREKRMDEEKRKRERKRRSNQ